jgi:hypothetical protein
MYAFSLFGSLGPWPHALEPIVRARRSSAREPSLVRWDSDRASIRSSHKVIHQHYGNSEQPFAALELPTVLRQFPAASRAELVSHVAPAFEAFNHMRKETLHLYAGVAETLRAFDKRGIKVVGHTEAIAINAWYRLRALDIAPLLSRLYALEGRLLLTLSPVEKRTTYRPMTSCRLSHAASGSRIRACC